METTTYPRLSVDLVAAAMNGKGSLSTLDRDQLARIEERYRMFLAIKAKHRNVRLAPTGLIDEMWHLHMLHPRAYYDDCMAMFGFILDHNPGFGAAAGERPALDRDFATTQFLWEAEFDVPFVDPSLTDDASSTLQGVVMCHEGEDLRPAKPPAAAQPDAMATLHGVVMCHEGEDWRPAKYPPTKPNAPSTPIGPGIDGNVQ